MASSVKGFAVTAASILLLLNACGGGGGSVTTGGASQGPVVSMPDPLSVSLEREESGPTAEKVLAKLQVHLSGGPWPARGGPIQHPPGLARFDDAPVVRIAEGTPDHDRELIHRVVALLNRELPYDLHLRIGEDAAALAAIEDVPDGQIFVDFAPEADWNDPHYRRVGANGIGQRDTVNEYDRQQQRWERKGLRAAHVWVNSDRVRADDHMLSVLMHEFLHVLGFPGHADIEQFPDSILAYGCCPEGHPRRIPEIDGAALRAIYMRYENGTEPEDLSIASLGPWDRTTVSLADEIGAVAFGVRHRNGVSVPWEDGDLPRLPLAENRALSGTVSWDGRLWGFTPSLSSVGGDAGLRVDLGTLAGRADFTGLRQWPEGETPNVETGAPWGPGTLGYAISVSGNYLRSTGGDDGVLSGAFYGPNHEGVAGSLERHDLTAAFGARR